MKKFTFTSLLAIVVIATTFAQPTLQWDKRFNGPASANDKGNAIAIDASGNVYVTGKSDGVGTGSDYLTIKYNSIGDTLWTRRYNGSANLVDESVAIWVDAAKNVYVTGTSQGNTSGFDIVTIKYNSTGIQQWASVFNGVSNGDDYGYNLTVDGAGNVYVVGYTYTASFGRQGVAIQYNPSGTQMWVKHLDVFGFDIAALVAVNNFGNVVVAVWGGKIFGVAGGDDYMIFEFNSIGTPVFTYNVSGGIGGGDVRGFPNAMALDGNGNMYVTSTIESKTEMYTARFNHLVNTKVWLSLYSTTGGSTIGGKDTKIDVANLNDVYVLGDLGNTNHDYYTIKYNNSTGTQIWAKQYNSPANLDDIPVSIALNKLSSPEIFVTGYTTKINPNGTHNITTVKYDNGGNQIWEVDYDCGNNGDDIASAMVLDNCDNVYITGASACDGTSQDVKTIKYASISSTITANGPITFCVGSTVTLTVSAANSYHWSNGLTTQSITVSSPDDYWVTVTNANGCTAVSPATTVTVNPLPSVSANASVMSVCIGSPVILTGSGASTYTWSNGVSNGVPFIPTTTTTYTVTGTDTNTGCQNTATKTITVNPLPSVSANASIMSVCVGSNTPVTLTGTGASTYAWSNGVLNGVPFVPTATTTYTVTGTDTNTGCQNTATKTITVNPLPSVGANASVMSVCVGSNTPVTLTGTGASTYAWSNGVLNGVPFVPTATTTYTVVGTDTNTGCQNTATKIITVNPLPSVGANASSISVCIGDPVTLTGSGASTYTWSNGVINGIPFNPTATTTYTVTGTDANGCQNTAAKLVIVNPLPTVGANASVMSVCSGMAVTLSGSGANSYTWSKGVANGIPFTPTATTTYTVTGTDGNGCKNTASKTVTVNPLPNVVADASAISICIYMNVILVASGASIYSWSNGVLNGVPFAPIATTTYTVIGTDTVTGCQNTATKTITVNPLPSVGANSSKDSICIGSNVTLTGSGASTYSWSNGVLDGVPFIPTSTATYAVTGTGSNGCQNTAIKTVTVNPLPPAPVVTPPGLVMLQEGDSVMLMASFANAWLWNTGETIQSITVSVVGNYWVIVTDINGCSAASDSTSIVVGTSEAALPEGFIISPNPSSGSFTVEFFLPEAKMVAHRVLNVLGQIVWASAPGLEAGKYHREIDLGRAVVPGIYLLETRLDGRAFLRKIVVR